ncbi:polysaccharide pyruvyl transferase family protein [Acuticoccus yangtzensis]|uniref:polysaccharide pyruvyl transferase family protein n=1 Tax=Acuticoccus yangtzensis TaxID=1443441 RepID=UPI000B2B11E3|nr:polysaccharide pyruvyl transferase family protein [Acuticoccus yangtzensis]
MSVLKAGTHLAVLGPPGAVADAGALSTEALLARVGANSGNLMFQRAAPRLFAEETVHVATLAGADAERVLAGARALVLPVANHLRLGTDWDGFASALERVDVPLIVLGLGSQAPGKDGEEATIAALKADRSVTRLAGVLADKAALVSVRGPFSQRVCEALGLAGTVALGCPSLFLNPRPDLGRAIAWRLGKARDKGAPDKGARDKAGARFALAAAAPFEIQSDPAKLEAERVLFAEMAACNGLYVQQSGGTVAVSMAKGDFAAVPLSAALSLRRILAPAMGLDDFAALMRERGRLFSDAAAWIDAVKPFDAVIGTRLHGNMAAIAGAIPGIVVTHDSRTGELVERMALPSLTLGDVTAAAAGEAGARATMLERARFDAARFDANRAEIAAGYRDAFAGLGLRLADEIAALAA